MWTVENACASGTSAYHEAVEAATSSASPPSTIAAVAVKNKGNGLDNPRAQLRNSAPTVEEVLASRMIAEPLTFLQCCPTSDGAGAAIVGPERGREGDLRIEASAMVSGLLWDHRSDDVWGYASVARAAEKA